MLGISTILTDAWHSKSKTYRMGPPFLECQGTNASKLSAMAMGKEFSNSGTSMQALQADARVTTAMEVMVVMAVMVVMVMVMGCNGWQWMVIDGSGNQS